MKPEMPIQDALVELYKVLKAQIKDNPKMSESILGLAVINQVNKIDELIK